MSFYSRYPKPRKGWDKDRIKTEIKKANIKGSFNKEVSNYDDVDELRKNIYFHGTGTYVDGALRPSIALSKRQTFRSGGYDEDYWAISLSKSKNLASNFTGDASSGSVYMVVLRQGATVIDMPEISDSTELEDYIVDLWTKGVDAVRIGNWEDAFSEKELAVINPMAIIKGPSESFRVFNKVKFSDPTDEELKTLINNAREKIAEGRQKSAAAWRGICERAAGVFEGTLVEAVSTFKVSSSMEIK